MNKVHLFILNSYDYLKEVNAISSIIKMLLAILCGGFMGLERGIKHRNAGLRTYILVCLGACIAMITGEYCYYTTHSGDVARLGAQVISGMGFLGAGMIIFSGNRIKGLTTAAGLWTCACIGLACGYGLYIECIVGTLLVCIVSGYLTKFDNKITGKKNWIYLTIEFNGMKVLWNVEEILRKKGFRISDVEIKHKDLTNTTMYAANIKNEQNTSMGDLYDELKKINGVLHVTIVE